MTRVVSSISMSLLILVILLHVVIVQKHVANLIVVETIVRACSNLAKSTDASYVREHVHCCDYVHDRDRAHLLAQDYFLD